MFEPMFSQDDALEKGENNPRRPLLERMASMDDKLYDVEQSLKEVFGHEIPKTGIAVLDEVGYDALDVAVRVAMTAFVQLEVYYVHHEYFTEVCKNYAKTFWISIMCLLEFLLIFTVLYPQSTSIWPPTVSWILRYQSLSTRRPRLLRELLSFIFITTVWLALMITYIVLYSIVLTYSVDDASMNDLFETECHKTFY